MKNLLPALHSAVVIITPLLFASAGGLFTELAGMLNIALEGLLLAGAFSAVAAVHYTGNLAAGLAAAILASLFLSALLAFATLKLRSNLFITGLAANLLAAGLTVILSQSLFNTKGVVALRDFRYPRLFAIPVIGDIPVIGELLSGHSAYVYSGWLLLLLSWIAIYRTPFGYRLRACGRHSAALESLGVRPGVYRWAAYLISGFCCGIGGSFLSLNLGAFVPNMTAGKGWIALVVIFLGGRKPQGLLAAAFVLGLAEALSNYAQGARRFSVPSDIILAIPYLLTLLAMVVSSAWVKRKSRVS
ncbi:MAG: ABC transporter permease [Treponema sp.]|nr:ABC transporter permease [Treponema sp.]MCL2126651.1 ABC transporter permease [Treponema sp.]